MNILRGVPALNPPEGWLGTKHHEPYDLITSPNVVEYKGWTRLSPLATYHNLSGELATILGILYSKHHAYTKWYYSNLALKSEHQLVTRIPYIGN
jgi:hypothetical protein